MATASWIEVRGATSAQVIDSYLSSAHTKGVSFAPAPESISDAEDDVVRTIRSEHDHVAATLCSLRAIQQQLASLLLIRPVLRCDDAGSSSSSSRAIAWAVRIPSVTVRFCASHMALPALRMLLRMHAALSEFRTATEGLKAAVLHMASLQRCVALLLAHPQMVALERARGLLQTLATESKEHKERLGSVARSTWAAAIGASGRGGTEEGGDPPSRGADEMLVLRTDLTPPPHLCSVLCAFGSFDQCIEQLGSTATERLLRPLLQARGVLIHAACLQDRATVHGFRALSETSFEHHTATGPTTLVQRVKRLCNAIEGLLSVLRWFLSELGPCWPEADARVSHARTPLSVLGRTFWDQLRNAVCDRCLLPALVADTHSLSSDHERGTVPEAVAIAASRCSHSSMWSPHANGRPPASADQHEGTLFGPSWVAWPLADVALTAEVCAAISQDETILDEARKALSIASPHAGSRVNCLASLIDRLGHFASKCSPASGRLVRQRSRDLVDWFLAFLGMQSVAAAGPFVTLQFYSDAQMLCDRCRTLSLTPHLSHLVRSAGVCDEPCATVADLGLSVTHEAGQMVRTAVRSLQAQVARSLGDHQIYVHVGEDARAAHGARMAARRATGELDRIDRALCRMLPAWLRLEVLRRVMEAVIARLVSLMKEAQHSSRTDPRAMASVVTPIIGACFELLASAMHSEAPNPLRRALSLSKANRHAIEALVPSLRQAKQLLTRLSGKPLDGAIRDRGLDAGSRCSVDFEVSRLAPIVREGASRGSVADWSSLTLPCCKARLSEDPSLDAYQKVAVSALNAAP